MRKNSQLIYALLIALILIIVFSQYTGAELLITDQYLVLMPYLLICLVGIFGVKNTKGVLGIFSYALFGVGLALTAYELNTLGAPIITDHLSLTFTIQHLQASIVILCVIVGAALKLD